LYNKELADKILEVKEGIELEEQLVKLNKRKKELSKAVI
jgi:hypothetical protein